MQYQNASFNAKHNNYNFTKSIKSIDHDCNYRFWHSHAFPIWNTTLPSRKTHFQPTFESLYKILIHPHRCRICWILIKASRQSLWCPSSSKRISVLVYWFFLFFLNSNPWMPFLLFSIKTSSFRKLCPQFFLITKIHRYVYSPFLYFINLIREIFLAKDFYLNHVWRKIHLANESHFPTILKNQYNSIFLCLSGLYS